MLDVHPLYNLEGYTLEGYTFDGSLYTWSSPRNSKDSGAFFQLEGVHSEVK